MTRTVRVAASCAFVALLVSACSSSDASTGGTYTLAFPSTAAAVATDFIQVLVFDAPASGDARATFCQTLIKARLAKEQQTPSASGAEMPICEALIQPNRRPVVIPYGDKAVLAVARRQTSPGKLEDFLIGCNIQTFGDGSAPLPVSLSLVDIASSVPRTDCAALSDWCGQKCR